MKLMNDNKGNAGAMWLLGGILAFLVVIGGFMTEWYGLAPAAEEEAAATAAIVAEEIKTGDIASFKLSSEDSQDNPTRYAGTGYCWNTATPTKLKGGGSVSLSASAATSIPSVTVNEMLKCVAFDSTHYGIIKDIKVEGESDEDTVSTLNASSTHEFRIEEDGTVEVGTVSIPASGTDGFNRWFYKANVVDEGLNLKMVCLGRNTDNTTEITKVEMAGLTKTTTPYRKRNQGATCFQLPQAIYIEDNNEEEFGAIKITVSGSFATRELLNLTFIDEAYYESIDGSIKLGVETDTDTPSDVGVTDIAQNINITVG